MQIFCHSTEVDVDLLNFQYDMSMGGQTVCCHLTVHPSIVHRQDILTFFSWDISRLHFQSRQKPMDVQPVSTVVPTFEDLSAISCTSTIWTYVHIYYYEGREGYTRPRANR